MFVYRIVFTHVVHAVDVLRSRLLFLATASMLPIRSRMVAQLRSAHALRHAATTPGLPTASFGCLGLMPELSQVVARLGFQRPSAPQTLAVPPLIAGESVAFASSTGSGKTLAYLLPMIHHLRKQETARPALRAHGAAQAGKCKPRALVLTPTRDLAAQVGAVAKAISKQFPLRVRTAEGGTRLRDTKRKLMESGADLVVATPSRLLLLHRLGVISLRQVRHIVVDEADDVLLRGFEEELRALVRLCPPRRGTPLEPQLAFVSATLSGAVQHAIRREFGPDVRLLVSSCAHRTPPSLRHELRPVAGDKLDELRTILSAWHSTHNTKRVLRDSTPTAPTARTLIFCRGVQSARAVQHALSDCGMPVGGCHGQMSEESPSHRHSNSWSAEDREPTLSPERLGRPADLECGPPREHARPCSSVNTSALPLSCPSSRRADERASTPSCASRRRSRSSFAPI